jgi:hypothetical protein
MRNNVGAEAWGRKVLYHTITVDYTRKVWVYFLKEKSRNFKTFTEFKSRIKKEFGREIKV